jgi:hypothetical protein
VAFNAVDVACCACAEDRAPSDPAVEAPTLLLVPPVLEDGARGRDGADGRVIGALVAIVGGLSPSPEAPVAPILDPVPGAPPAPDHGLGGEARLVAGGQHDGCGGISCTTVYSQVQREHACLHAFKKESETIPSSPGQASPSHGWLPHLRGMSAIFFD